MNVTYDHITTTAWHTPMDFDGEECWVSAEIANEDSQFPENYIEYGILVKVLKKDVDKKDDILKSSKDDLIDTIKKHYKAKTFVNYDGGKIKIERPYIYNKVMGKWELINYANL